MPVEDTLAADGECGQESHRQGQGVDAPCGESMKPGWAFKYIFPTYVLGFVESVC